MKKPYPSYPLSPHSSGQWAKKIKGRRYYFGTDWKEALAKYEAFIKQPELATDEYVIADLVESFMDTKESLKLSGEIKPDTLLEYHRTTKRLVAVLGKFTPLDSLEPTHFSRLRSELAQSMSSVTLKGQIIRLRSIFAHAYEVGLVNQPLRYESSLKTPAARLMRQARVESRDSKLFDPWEISNLISVADGYMLPAIWLGINCGLGNTDVCDLRWSNIVGGWLDFPRPKTAVERRSRLWPETEHALEEWRKLSPQSEYVCCGLRGQQLGSGESNNTPIAKKFISIAERVGVVGRGFYALRHTYRTVADGAGDEPAVYLTMGHADTRIAATYRHRIEKSRLSAVADFVRAWMTQTVISVL